jgi:hypothetical protein
MSKMTLMAMFLAFVAVAPVGAADTDTKATSRTEVIVVGDYSRESVDCFYEQNRYLPECKK